MTLDTGQQVRLKIQDIPAIADAVYYGDGTATTYPLPNRNITSGSAFVPPVGQPTAWLSTGATFDVSGWVAFSSEIPANSAFRVRYVHSVFSDDEIGHFTAVGGSVNGAAIEAVQALMFDGLKRASWGAPDGSEYDDTAAIALLKSVYETLKEEQADEAAAQGGISSWSLNQANY